MFRNYAILLLLCIAYQLHSQTNSFKTFTDNDTAYREDQFYAAISYNLLVDKPAGVSQNSFSPGINIGFIRDMPINPQRNIAFGIGLGLSANVFNQNIIHDQTNGVFSFNLPNTSDEVISVNRFSTYVIELPIEFRWRTSTAKQYEFWRIYLGFKLGYVIHNSSKFKSNLDSFKLRNNPFINTFQYGPTLSAGYGNWNFHVHYGLNTLYNSDAMLSGNRIAMQSLKLGLIFYIL